MKKYNIIILLLFCVWETQAQNRLHVADLSQFQHYYNPALTAYSGSAVKAFYRDQATGFERNPLTGFLSGEFNLADIAPSLRGGNIRHAAGLLLMYDKYGATTRQNIGLSYGAGIPVSNTLRVQAGVTLTYANAALDFGELSPGSTDDPAFTTSDDRMNRFGLHVGVALTGDDFYVGYALRDAVQKDNPTDHPFAEAYMQQALQAGYRRQIIAPLGLIVNGAYRYDENQEGVFEGQLKAVLHNSFWVGGGYRQDLAYSVTAGVRIKQFKVGYSREIASGNNVSPFYKGGNEITLSYHLAPIFGGNGLTIW